MNKLAYIVFILCLFHSLLFANEVPCDIPEACNFGLDEECDGAPGLVQNLTINQLPFQNFVEIAWSEPNCGIGLYFNYFLVGDIDGEVVDISIS